jgi:hypothetical protein
MIRLPIYSLPDSPLQGAVRGLIFAYKHIGTLKAEINRLRSKLIMRNLPYERSWLAECLRVVGFKQVEFRTFQVSSNQSWHDFVLSKKQVPNRC